MLVYCQSLQDSSCYMQHSHLHYFFICNRFLVLVGSTLIIRVSSLGICLWLGLCNMMAEQLLTSQKTFCVVVFHPVLHVHTTHAVHTVEKYILDSDTTVNDMDKYSCWK